MPYGKYQISKILVDSASYALNGGSGVPSVSSSYANTASYAETASYVLNSGNITVSSPNKSIQFNLNNQLSSSALLTWDDNGTIGNLYLTGSININSSVSRSIDFITPLGHLYLGDYQYGGTGLINNSGSIIAIYDQESNAYFYANSSIAYFPDDDPNIIFEDGVGLRITNNGVSSSLFGTASWALNSISASYINLIAGPNITINKLGNLYQISGSIINTSSFITNSQTASLLSPYLLISQTSSINVTTSSYSITTSFYNEKDPIFNLNSSSYTPNSKTGSFITNSQTSSINVTSSISSSYLTSINNLPLSYRKMEMWTDFIGFGTDSDISRVFPLVSSVGTAAGFQAFIQSSTNRIGISPFQLGTSTLGGYGYALSRQTIPQNITTYGANGPKNIFSIEFQTPSATSSFAGNAWIFRTGFFNTADAIISGSIANGVIFEYNGSLGGANTGSWRCITSNASVQVVTITGTYSVSTWVNLRVEIQNQTASFYKDNNLIALHTSSVPLSAATNVGFSVCRSGSITTPSITYNMDYAYYSYEISGSSRI